MLNNLMLSSYPDTDVAGLFQPVNADALDVTASFEHLTLGQRISNPSDNMLAVESSVKDVLNVISPFAT